MSIPLRNLWSMDLYRYLNTKDYNKVNLKKYYFFRLTDVEQLELRTFEASEDENSIFRFWTETQDSPIKWLTSCLVPSLRRGSVASNIIRT